MNRAHSAIVRACSWPAVHTGTCVIGMAVICMAALPRPTWGQSAVWPQDATTGSIYYNGGNVGIGTTTPGAKLTIVDVSGANVFFGQSNAGTAAQGTLARSANTDQAAFKLSPAGPASPTNPTWYFALPAGSPGAAIQSYDGAAIVNRLTVDPVGNVGIGTTNPQHLLHVAGTIGAEEVIVSSTGADYVFEPDYRLKPLSEVDSYIRANHHLPDIPSAEEVKQEGIGVGDMEAKLLAKIEELTLHMIRADQENHELRKQNSDLQERVARLEAK